MLGMNHNMGSMLSVRENNLSTSSLDLVPANEFKKLNPWRYEEAYFVKQGGSFQSWKRRFFVLDKFNKTLDYYSQENDYRKVGRIDLSGRVVREGTRSEAEGNLKFALQLEREGHRTYYLVSDSLEQKNCWREWLILAMQNGLPALGVSPQFLKDFIEEQQSEITKETTTREVALIVQEKTKDYATKFWAMCHLEEDSNKIGKSTVFVTHAWDCPFLLVINKMLEYSKDLENVYFWFDLFCSPQLSLGTKTENWWYENLKTTVKSVGKTIIVLPSISDPIPFGRTWCLLEIILTLQEFSSSVQILVCNQSLESLVDYVIQNSSEVIDTFQRLIQTEKAEATDTEEKKLIDETLKSMKTFSQLDGLVKSFVYEWLTSVLEQDLKKRNEQLANAEKQGSGNTRALSENLAAAQHANGRLHMCQAQSYLASVSDS
eukprot:Lithocolla_globosa_v1_NODE_4792_length_1365_cov_3.761069.p1 type:complete len:432 gc:universal NODE_4792_length_1365_cov_3.761069:1301-6(-)